MASRYEPGEDYAFRLDAEDPLAGYRDRFYLPRDSIYMDGNSLGLMSVDPEELVVTGGTTVNLHALVSTFYKPKGRKRKILADELNFPSDLYALSAQVRPRGGDPHGHLV